MAEALRSEQIREITGKVDRTIRDLAEDLRKENKALGGGLRPSGWGRFFHRGPSAREQLQIAGRMAVISEDMASLSNFRKGLMVSLGEEKPHVRGRQTYQFELYPHFDVMEQKGDLEKIEAEGK